MGKIQYPYSISSISFSATLFLVAILAMTCYFWIRASSRRHGVDLWITGFVALVFIVFLVYFCGKFMVPWKKGEVAMEMDKEKLQFFSSNKTVFWKDVKHITAGNAKYGFEVRFYLKGGERPVVINIIYVAGDDEKIFATINEYFEKYKV